MAAEVSFSVANTVAWKLTLNLTSEGEPWYVQGYRARMHLRSDALSDVAILRLDSHSVPPTLFLEESAVRIDVPAGLARSVPPGAYAYDLLIFDGDPNDPTRVAEGTITVKQGVTR